MESPAFHIGNGTGNGEEEFSDAPSSEIMMQLNSTLNEKTT